MAGLNRLTKSSGSISRIGNTMGKCSAKCPVTYTSTSASCMMSSKSGESRWSYDRANAYSVMMSVVSAIMARLMRTTSWLPAAASSLPHSLATLLRMVGWNASTLRAEKNGAMACRRLRCRSCGAVEKASLAQPKRAEK